MAAWLGGKVQSHGENLAILGQMGQWGWRFLDESQPFPILSSFKWECKWQQIGI